jgi:hypothetical protein
MILGPFHIMELHMTDFLFSIPTDVLRAALVCVSSEETRYYLKGVNVAPDADDVVLVSTDGHRLFCGRCPLPPAGAVTPSEPFIVPTDAIKKALTGYKGLGIQLQRTGDIWTLGDVTFKPVDGVFPDFRRVVPTQKTISDDLGKIAQFNPAYVADMGKVAKAVAPTTRGAVALPIIHHMGSGPAVVTFSGREDLFCLVMPMRGEMRDKAELGFLTAHVTQDKAATLAAMAKRKA